MCVHVIVMVIGTAITEKTKMRQIFWRELKISPSEEFIHESVNVATFDGISPTNGGTQTTTIYYRSSVFFRVTTDAFNTKWWIGNIT